MSFLGRAEQTGPEIEFAEPTPDDLEIPYTDTKLQSNETETSVKNILLAIYYAAKTSLKEQGVNILYITLERPCPASYQGKIVPGPCINTVVRK